MLIGGSSSSGSTPSQRSDAARLASIRFQRPSTINAGFGSCASSSRLSDSRSGRIISPSKACSRYGGAKPPASSSRLRSAIGRSRCWARWTSSWRLGLDRPVSTKLRCLVETFASRESSSWLRPRRPRQKRINSPAVWGSCSVWTTTRLKLAGRRYTRGNGRAAFAPGALTATQSDTVEVRMNISDPNELAERYTAVWMEPDGDRRRKAIADLWSEDAIHILQPTQEVYEAAAERAVNPTWQVRGHGELEARVTSAYEDFVATGQMSFRSRQGAKRLGDVVTWRWEGVSPDGEVLGAGLEFVILAADGRIATDYQFVE